MMFQLKLAREFSRYPSGRNRMEGPYNAEDFLILLYKKLNKYPFICLDLDDTKGYGNCFLHEVFTRLSEDELRRMIVVSSDPLLLEECRSYNPNIKTAIIEKKLSLWDKIKSFFTKHKEN